MIKLGLNKEVIGIIMLEKKHNILIGYVTSQRPTTINHHMCVCI